MSVETIYAYGLKTRVWTFSENHGYGCAECCNKDRCDEECTATYERKDCPHCKGKGWIQKEAVEEPPPEQKSESFIDQVGSNSEDYYDGLMVPFSLALDCLIEFAAIYAKDHKAKRLDVSNDGAEWFTGKVREWIKIKSKDERPGFAGYIPTLRQGGGGVMFNYDPDAASRAAGKGIDQEIAAVDYDECRQILEELVELKILKEALDKVASIPPEYSSLVEKYKKRKPAAWEKAKAFLKKDKT